MAMLALIRSLRCQLLSKKREAAKLRKRVAEETKRADSAESQLMLMKKGKKNLTKRSAIMKGMILNAFLL